MKIIIEIVPSEASNRQANLAVLIPAVLPLIVKALGLDAQPHPQRVGCPPGCCVRGDGEFRACIICGQGDDGPRVNA